MERLKKINTILFTIMSIILSLLGVVFLFFAISEMLPTKYSTDRPQILANNLTEVDSVIARQQKISIGEPVLIDTSSMNKLIPIRIVNLETPEEVNELVMLMDRSSANDYSFYYGDYVTNYVFIYSTTGEQKIIFNMKSFIPQYVIDHKNEVILFAVINDDSNGDNFLNDEDEKKLIVFSINDGSLKEIDLNGKIFIGIEQPYYSNSIFIKLATDLNKNGQYESNKEPVSQWNLDVANLRLNPIVSEESISKLQEILDQ